MSILVVKDISCQKGERCLFSAVSLHLNAGEILYVTGENGAGKTSLLRILTGLSESPTGQVLINQLDVHKERNFASSHLLYFGHKQGISPMLSAIENLRYWSQQQGIPTNTDTLYHLLAELGLECLEDMPVKHLSAGQQRRVALARLWLKSETKIWILDEPFTALDASLIRHLEEKIDNFAAQGGAVVMTSHQIPKLASEPKTLHMEYNW